MSTKRDYYEILKIAKNASLGDIKKAYREAVLRSHPDRVPAEQKKEAEEQFKLISEAYAVLSDAKKRALYDQYGHAGIDQQYAYEDIFKEADFGSVFEGRADYGVNETLFDQVFSNFGFDVFGRGGRGGRRPTVSQDIQIALKITLEEAYEGAEKKVSFFRRTKRTLKVTVPKGVDTGTELKVKGAGGQTGDRAGDLYVVVTVEPHPIFGRKDANLILLREIPVTKAILGGDIKLPLLSGKTVTMKIPEGTQNGTVFSLRGKGMPRFGS